ncbi:hypothetical protein BS47DRAFT_1488764 [Hydnum rufescens UP504]|uniref:Transmembrane protein n=1 Tax=Hydnum rufescens UP504 TaxID=1448309 RepID=A0A9P6AMQ2_9AGAM|nr:hypothetical protein BS47DRAFT_1488764 [Hydnum rufescens UP504]
MWALNLKLKYKCWLYELVVLQCSWCRALSVYDKAASMISIIVLVGVFIGRFLPFPTVQAQTSNVTCLPSFNWSDNSLGQSPCLQAAWLQAECNDGDWGVDSLPPDYHYIGPTSDNSTENACICTTVVYNLLSACGACQNLIWITWTSWSFFCVDYRYIKEGTYNVTIPYGTSIPAWAFDLPSHHNDTFNISAAKNIGDSPERTGGTLSPTSTSTSTPSFTTSGSLLTGYPSSASSSSSPTQSGGSRGSTSNVGAIAGGVAGGVVGLALIGLAGFLLLRKRRPPSTVPSQDSDRVLISSTSAGFSGVSGRGGTTLSGSGPEMVNADNRPRSFPSVYDPNDPSTYPTTPSQATGSNHLSFPAPALERDPVAKYSGVPEL